MYIPAVVTAESPDVYFQSGRKTNLYYSVSEPLITGSHENGFETENQFIGLRIQQHIQFHRPYLLSSAQAESVDDVAIFKGAKRSCTKECILIINTETGVS